MQDILKYRVATPEDEEYVINSWIDNYKNAHAAGILSVSPLSVQCDCGREVGYDWDTVMQVTVANLLRKDGVQTLVAYNPHEKAPDDVYGWLVWEKDPVVPSYKKDLRRQSVLVLQTATCPMVHYCYVKHVYRRFGIAKELFAQAGINPNHEFIHSCKTPTSTDICRRYPKAKWHPLPARYEKEAIETKPND